MFKNYYIYSVYTVALIAFGLYFCMSFMPDGFVLSFAYFYIVAILLYFIGGISFSRIQNKFEMISDIMLFITLNVIGYGLMWCLITFFPYSIYLLLINVIAAMLFTLAFIIRLTKYISLDKKQSKESK